VTAPRKPPQSAKLRRYLVRVQVAEQSEVFIGVPVFADNRDAAVMVARDTLRQAWPFLAVLTLDYVAVATPL
jgi:hypothetical protein